MRWYKHPTDLRRSAFLKAIRRSPLGCRGALAWINLYEFYAEEFEGEGREFLLRRHILDWLEELCLSKNNRKLFLELLDLAQSHSQLTYKQDGDYFAVCIPQMLESADEYTRKVQTSSRVRPVQNRLQESRFHENGFDSNSTERERDQIASLPQKVPSEEEVQEVLNAWKGTLSHFGFKRKPEPGEVTDLKHQLTIHGLQNTRQAIVGARFDQKSETFDPAQCLSVRRIFRDPNFQRFLSFGEAAERKENANRTKEAQIAASRGTEPEDPANSSSLSPDEQKKRFAEIYQTIGNMPTMPKGGVA